LGRDPWGLPGWKHFFQPGGSLTPAFQPDLLPISFGSRPADYGSLAGEPIPNLYRPSTRGAVLLGPTLRKIPVLWYSPARLFLLKGFPMPPRAKKTSKLRWNPPSREITETGFRKIWQTQCGQYRVVEIQPIGGLRRQWYALVREQANSQARWVFVDPLHRHYRNRQSAKRACIWHWQALQEKASFLRK